RCHLCCDPRARPPRRQATSAVLPGPSRRTTRPPPPRRQPSLAALSGPTSPPRYSSRRPTVPRCSSRPSTALCFPSPPRNATLRQAVHGRYPSPFTTANQGRSTMGRSTKAMVPVKTRCISSSFVCFSVHLLPDGISLNTSVLCSWY
uniref:Uncharacterized protein n=1 Tax=Triticum urartu TaxID=4572 RepID=A0A8R7USY3_TRIUA